MKVILIGHGRMASGLLASLDVIVGTHTDIEAIDFLAGMSHHDIENALKNTVCQEGGTIILCDLLGGTPFKVAVELKQSCQDQKIEVIAGLNLAMLLEVVFAKDTLAVEELIAPALAAAKQGVVDANSLLKAEESLEAEVEFGI